MIAKDPALLLARATFGVAQAQHLFDAACPDRNPTGSGHGP